ncbi:hypothetical protein M3A96_00745 [Helcobacillus massiliensis]|uniref:hypothetical protein n=1 Tax=Helcobacillus massiliensis TaxID=521392 RepID=UPI0021A50B08|nr:hypothetical protein [Helcobacillus massiliensis]MCT1556657.1 hypothetical protein [Helcobacillus massiliensis]MCT2035851.1 hypothetical protein [Helcobacillus massiliensis]MCT2331067.1 hypothetical protein [Helcobacillus massiliensis]
MFDDVRILRDEDRAALRALLSTDAPASSADAFRALPAILADGDDTPAAIRARIDLTLLSILDGFVDSAVYQVDELTKDARRVADLSGDQSLPPAADAVRDAVETAAQHSTI